MTNTPDPTAVRDSLARWREFNRRCDGGESPVTAEAVLHNDDMAVLCFAYDAEHDPTPLTVEVLVGRGGKLKDDSDWIYTFGKLIVYPDGPVDSWGWEYCGPLLPKWLKPRTAGELRQLLMRMGK